MRHIVIPRPSDVATVVPLMKYNDVNNVKSLRLVLFSGTGIINMCAMKAGRISYLIELQLKDITSMLISLVIRNL